MIALTIKTVCVSTQKKTANDTEQVTSDSERQTRNRPTMHIEAQRKRDGAAGH